MALRLRCKSDNGTQTLPAGLSPSSTLQDLMLSICSVCGISPEFQKIMIGYPPKPLDLSNLSATLSNLKINNGETLIVNDTDKTKIIEKQTAVQVKKVAMKRREVPADNSCLFYSVYFALHKELDQRHYDLAKQYRSRIASVVVSNPDKFSQVYLEKTADDYATWIQCDTSWGGAIELSILSEMFQIEIAAIDIQSLRADQFGQDQHYKTRIFLLYDGAHYDPIYLDPGDSALPMETIFACTDTVAFEKALTLAGDYHRSRQFVDFQNFKLRCITCNEKFTGQAAARKHAEKTGHGNYGEV